MTHLLRHLAVILALLAGLAGGAHAAERELLLATTTSVQDTGLLDALLPVFTERTGIHVRVVAVGSGAALRMGADGNADALVTHAPEAEQKLLAEGAIASRVPFMENHFVIAGPADDPAGVRVAPTAVEAFRRIHAARASFASRGDDSGTHQREQALWREAGIDPAKAWPGFLRTGSGMGPTLLVAGERRAYVLTDVGSFLRFRERTGLAALSRPDPSLRNVYSVLRVNPDRFPGRIRAEEARAFEAFLFDPGTQQRIAEFGKAEFGEPLFRPLGLPPAAGASGD